MTLKEKCKRNQNNMKNNQFIQCFLFEKQKKQTYRQRYFHLMVFGAFAILFKINQVGCADKNVNKKLYEDEASYLEQATENSQEDLSYDPWRDSERPKLFVDYLHGPLKGRTFNFELYFYR